MVFSLVFRGLEDIVFVLAYQSTEYVCYCNTYGANRARENLDSVSGMLLAESPTITLSSRGFALDRARAAWIRVGIGAPIDRDGSRKTRSAPGSRRQRRDQEHGDWPFTVAINDQMSQVAKC
jgi:hypothetical protein